MCIEMKAVLTITILTVVYFIIGFGAAKAEKEARNSKEIDRITVFTWPIALMSWCFSGL